MTRYDLFEQLERIHKLAQTGENEYNKIVQSGELVNTFSDHGTGYYDVFMHIEQHSDTEYSVRVRFNTIDDGDFGARTYTKDYESAVKLLEKVKEKFKDMIVCPRHAVLNKEFRDIGVYFNKE